MGIHTCNGKMPHYYNGSPDREGLDITHVTALYHTDLAEPPATCGERPPANIR